MEFGFKRRVSDETDSAEHCAQLQSSNTCARVHNYSGRWVIDGRVITGAVLTRRATMATRCLFYRQIQIAVYTRH